jgi:BetR domain
MWNALRKTELVFAKNAGIFSIQGHFYQNSHKPIATLPKLNATMEATNIQIRFFQHLKALLPPHIAMVDEVADLLEISNDSAYRRIRGEKPIDLQETYKLCSHFKISMDQLLHLQSDAFIFSGILRNASDNNFEKWLENFHRQFEFVNSFERKHLNYLMKDIPPFVHFHIPELASFKFFFWMKSILHNEDLKGAKFSFNDPGYEKFHIISKKIIQIYSQIPTTEIWNIESINSSLRQIEFYREAGSFKNIEDVKLLYDKTEELINHIEKQAELGVKFNIGQKPAANAAEYRLFVNELILGDNTILAELNNTRITFLNHSVLYFVSTRDERFNTAMFISLENLIKKSTMISKIGEKERVAFFNRLRDIIHQHRALLK